MGRNEWKKNEGMKWKHKFIKTKFRSYSFLSPIIVLITIPNFFSFFQRIRNIQQFYTIFPRGDVGLFAFRNGLFGERKKG